MIYKSEKAYVDAIKPIAKRVGLNNSYLPSVLTAQCILETGYGGFADHSTESMIDNRNHLGMKSDLLNSTWSTHTVWNGVSFNRRTPEWYDGRQVYITDSFRKYESIEQCLLDFVMFMTWVKRDNGQYKYRNDVIGNSDPVSTIKAVRVNGYCTDPEYDKSILRIIDKWNLTELDEGFSNKNSTSKIKKLVAPRFIDNRVASKSQIPRWRDKSDVKYCVCHYLGVVGENFELWDNGYGATFTIAWNGDVYWTADYTAVTWQCGGGRQGPDGGTLLGKCTNFNSVSIECCVKRTDNKYEGDDNDDKWYFTEQTQESLVWAVSKLMDDLNIPFENAVRHFDITGKICPNPYVRNNGKNGNWTWEQFKANLAQYRKDGTITLYNGADPTPTPEPKRDYLKKGDSGESVKTMQTMLNACGYNCGEVDGYFGANTYNALFVFQKDHGLTTDGLYGAKSKSALESAYKDSQKQKDTSQEYKAQMVFLKTADDVVKRAKEEGWTYGDSQSKVPCKDKKISCDRLVARTIWQCGFRDQRQGGETCSTLDTYLKAHGWTKVKEKSKIKAGAIVAVKDKNREFINHVFIVKSYDYKTDYCTKYDTGSIERLKSEQPFKDVRLVEWKDREFVCAWNLPSYLAPGISDGRYEYEGVDYGAVFNYKYYAKMYPDLKKIYGSNRQKLFKHFCENGMREGRQGDAEFCVHEYRDRYSDLKEAFGVDLPKYYKHYVEYGQLEGRNGN